jgi:hypothetical protein
MFMHSEEIRGNPGIRFLFLPSRTGSLNSSCSITQYFRAFTGVQRCWDHEGSHWPPVVQSFPGSRVGVTDFQAQEVTCQSC